jgi:hypothetical protein
MAPHLPVRRISRLGARFAPAGQQMVIALRDAGLALDSDTCVLYRASAAPGIRKK